MTGTEISKIKSRIVNEFCTIFSRQLEELEKYEKLVDQEIASRKNSIVSNKEYKKIMDKYRLNIEKDLQKYKNTEILQELQKYKKINKEFSLTFEHNINEEVVVLYMQDVLLKNGNLGSSYYVKNPIYYISLDFKCTNCGHKNIVKSIGKTPKNILNMKCGSCGLVAVKDSRDNKDFLPKVSTVELSKKMNTFMSNIEVYEKSFLKKDIEYGDIQWSDEEAYRIYNRYKDSVPVAIMDKWIDPIINKNRDWPLFSKVLIDEMDYCFYDQFEDYETYSGLYYEVLNNNIQMEDLEKYGIVEAHYRDITADDVINWILSAMSIRCIEHTLPFHRFAYDENIWSLSCIGLRGYSPYQSYDSYTKDDINTMINKFQISPYVQTGYKINMFYFEKEKKEEKDLKAAIALDNHISSVLEVMDADKAILPKDKHLNLFRSKKHQLVFKALKRDHKKTNIILPNYEISKVVNLEEGELEHLFSKSELENLARSVFDFVAYDKKGKVLGVYSLVQDDLKRKLCEKTKINYLLIS